MEYLRRGFGAFILFALCLSMPVFAQDSEPVTIAGSGIALPLIQSLADASQTNVVLNVEAIGTAAGLDAFCTNTVPTAAATRPLNATEEAKCSENGIEYMELIVGHQALALVANPEDTFLTCLDIATLDSIFAPASTVANWSELNDTYSDEALTISAPNSDSIIYALLDNIVKGDGIRSTAQFPFAEDIIAAVSTTKGTIGVVDLQTAQAHADKVTLISLDTPSGETTTGCIPPAASSVETRVYPAALSVYLYVNRANTEAVRPLLDFITDETVAAAVTSSTGFTPVSVSVYQTNRRVVNGELTGRVFSESENEFQIPANLTGEIAIAGAGDLFDYFKGASDALTTTNTALTFAYKMEGEAAGIRRLCNGEVDLVVVYDGLTEDQQAACAANNVTIVTFPLGSQVVVMLGHAGDDYSLCLTKEQIVTIWGAPSTDTVETWQAVGEDFPDTPLTLFGINEGSTLSDLLLSTVDAPVLPVRIDTELNADPLYRAAATANVEGALTYMSWLDYQRVLGNAQERIQLVSVDAGNGCVLPSEATFADGSYPLLRATQIIVAEEALADINVQSYLWSLFTNDNYNLLVGQGLIGADFNNLPEIRRTLQAAFDAAVASQSALGAEVTPKAESTAEATAEATEAAPVETAEATTEPTVEATAEAEPTTEATPEAEATSAS